MDNAGLTLIEQVPDYTAAQVTMRQRQTGQLKTPTMAKGSRIVIVLEALSRLN